MGAHRGSSKNVGQAPLAHFERLAHVLFDTDQFHAR
jgi:hypothetical protein